MSNQVIDLQLAERVVNFISDLKKRSGVFAYPIFPTIRAIRVCGLVTGLSMLNMAHAQDILEWSEAGATHKYFNSALKMEWRLPGGAWVDADGVHDGDHALASATLVKGQQTISLDVTEAVKNWLSNAVSNRGFLIRSLSGAPVKIHSRESSKTAYRPTLFIETAEGLRLITADADTNLSSSTVRAQGGKNILNLANNTNVLLSFPLDSLRAKNIKRAELVLKIQKIYSGGSPVIGVFYCSTMPSSGDDTIHHGLALANIDSPGLDQNEATFFYERFDKDDWQEKWEGINRKNPPVIAKTVRDHSGWEMKDVLRVLIPAGGRLGLNLRYKFKAHHGEEPESLYFRYYLMFDENWHPAQGGKLPGLAGTYGVAGWGGRSSDGYNGWSTRGLFGRLVDDNNPLVGRVPIGFYAYYAGQKGSYGEAWYWPNRGLGAMEPGRWYSIEQYIQLNNIGEKDGVARGWVDGKLAFEKKGLEFRRISDLKIEEVWMNVYHGGTRKAPRDLTLYIDEVVAARSYIGPLPMEKNNKRN